MSKARDLADFISTGSILSDGTIESTEISGVTADATEINKLDGLTADTAELNKLDGVTATTDELNKLAGTTATTSDFDKLSNVTASATELNYMSGATSSIQSQLDNISVTSGSLTKSFTNGETASITLSSALSTAPVVSVTKEIAQTGQSSKGAWDVNATASNYDLHNTAYATTLAKSVTSTGTAYGTSPLGGAITYTNSSTGTSGLNCRAFGMSPDGTKAIVIGDGANMHSLSLSTAFDISTASVTVSNGPSGWPTNSLGGYVKSDGTKMWVVDYSQGSFTEYNLNTAWDVSSKSSVATYTTNVPSQIIDVYWKPDGMMCFLADYQNADIYQFTVTTAFDFSTAGTPYTYSMTSVTGQLMNIQFKPDGTELYATINSTNAYGVTKISLNTAWDLSGTVTESAHIADLSASPFSLSINAGFFEYYNNGGAIFYAPYGNDTITQFNVQTSSTGLTLGTGSFASTDVGKRIQGNGGDVILTSTAGAYDTTGGSDFTDTSTIASGSWTMHGLKSAGATDGLTLAGVLPTSTISTVDVFNDNSCQYLLELDNDLLDTGGNYNASGVNSFNTGSKYGTHAFFTGGGNTFTSQLNQPENSGWMMSFWFRRDGTSGLSNNNRMVDFKENVLTQGTTISFENDSRFHFILKANNHGNGSRQIGGASDLCDDAWHHIVVGSGNGSTIRAYVDGVAVTSNSGYNRSDSHEGTGILWGNGYGGNCTNSYYDQIRYFNRELTASEVLALYDEGGGVGYIPASQYHVGVTNVGGQIDTGFWTDINSMTADQAAGDGTVHYAVSTDDRTTWSVAKASDGVRPIVRDNAGTWQYNSDAGTTVGNSLANGSYNSNFDLSTISVASNGISEIQWVNNGNHLMVLGNSNDYVTRWNASTPYDINSLSLSQNFNVSGQEIYLTSMHMSPDGYHLYVGGNQGNDVNEYTLTTAFDLFSASFTRNTVSVGNIGAIWFKPDGTKMYTMSFNGVSVRTWNLSTAWDTSTAIDQGGFNLPNSSTSGASAMVFSDDGYHLYVSFAVEDVVKHYTLSTAWDVSTVSTNPASLSYASQGSNMTGLTFNSDFTEMHTGTGSTLYKYDITQSSYSTSATWTNATTNDEFYALQQALGVEFNRMDKTQLDAVADGSHFTLGDTLDLAIALKQDTASASLPTSDGVSINYDAQALNQGAVLGTDYDFDFPDSTTVRITSNAAQNLKIRVV